MSECPITDDAPIARRIVLHGLVQGLGVRPAIARAARRADLVGSVRNVRSGLEIDVEGAAIAVERFVRQLWFVLPAGACSELESAAEIPLSGRADFRIEPSNHLGERTGAAPLDRATCTDCLAEVHDAGNRRFGYAFTSCASCGPRYSILERMPFDRETTAMRDFPRCARCDEEYRDPEDRRYHAEATCCPDCGPQLWATAGDLKRVVDGALAWVAEVVRDGGIAAIKGIGGYQLIADANDPVAVRRLRERKRRPAKPLAVMVRTLEDAECVAKVTALERKWLASAENPIVVVRQRSQSILALEEIVQGCGGIGLFLPTSALHDLLLEQIGRPFVCTSGNVEGEPLAFDEKEAEARLRGVADVWLHHDRRIVRPIDDSVVREIAGERCIMRAGRGLAPWTVQGPLESVENAIFAVGGDMKSAVALWNGRDAVLGPHIGELTDLGVCERWIQESAAQRDLYGVTPNVVARDLHPDFFSSRRAEQLTDTIVTVQHHHAHAAAVLWEHGECDTTAVALTWDGTGHGDDGVAWGGECLLASLMEYDRVGHLLPFVLPGGDAAVREPWRIALSLATQCELPAHVLAGFWPDIAEKTFQHIAQLAAHPRLSPLSTSMGRLFDAVGALVLPASVAQYEGQLAMRLESICDLAEQGAYTILWNPEECIFDWRRMWREAVQDKLNHEAPGTIAMRFHRTVANLAARVSDYYADLPLVTCGGVFQNAVLGELLAERIQDRPSRWLRPRHAPPGDGGLALGQLAVAWARMRTSSTTLDRAC